jgi:hypothetical protein
MKIALSLPQHAHGYLQGSLAVNTRKSHSPIEEWPSEIALNSDFVWEPAGGFEPSTCCLRISWFMVYQCPLVSTNVEYFRIINSVDSTLIYACAWIFIHLAVKDSLCSDALGAGSLVRPVLVLVKFLETPNITVQDVRINRQYLIKNIGLVRNGIEQIDSLT